MTKAVPEPPAPAVRFRHLRRRRLAAAPILALRHVVIPYTFDNFATDPLPSYRHVINGFVLARITFILVTVVSSNQFTFC